MPQLYYSPVTVDHLQVLSTQTNFAVKVGLTDNRFRTVANGGHVANGNDLRPYANSSLASALPYELERHNPVTGEVVMHVKIPSLSSLADLDFFLGYGDASLVSDGSSNPFDANCVARYGLKNGTVLSVTDSTGVNNGTNVGGTAAAGQIDGAISLVRASSQYVDCGNNASLDITGKLSISAWINANTLPANGSGLTYTVFAKGYDGTNTAYFFDFDGGTTAGFRFATYNGAPHGALYYPVTNFSTGVWYYMVGTFDLATWTLYKDGTSVLSTPDAVAPQSTTQKAAIGAQFATGTPGGFWDGLLDELRVWKIDLTPNTIATEYNNQKPASTFLGLGSEVPLTGGASGRTVIICG